MIPDETESPGPFNLDDYPHVRDVLEAWDDASTRKILLDWAARCAKTTTAVSCMAYSSQTAPRPSLYVNATDKMAEDAVESQIEPLLEACDATARGLPPKHKRNKRAIRLARNRIRVGFAGSSATLRGFPACYGHLSEVSAWPRQRKSSDADTRRLVNARFKLFPFDSKQLYESTPGLAGECNITDMIDSRGVDRRYRFARCPHCKHYQRLVWGDSRPDSPGVKFAKDSKGRLDPTIAEETAFYQCENGCRIEDVDRRPLLRDGVWLSEGQRIDKRGRVVGKPLHASSTVAFSGISTLYSLGIGGWGQIAAEFCEAMQDRTREALRNFWNQVLGLVWDPKPIQVKPHELGERLGTDDSIGIVPEWAVFLTRAIDVQDDAYEFHWQVCGWGPNARGAVIDYGITFTEAELCEQIRGEKYSYAHGQAIKPLRTIIDSGAFTEDVYRIVRQTPGCIAAKGSSTSDFPEMIVGRALTEETKQRRRKRGLRSDPNQTLYALNTERTNRWVEAVVQGLIDPAAPNGFTLPQEAANDGAFLDELLNEYGHSEQNKNGYLVRVWTKTGPNEQRDALRMNRALAELVTNNGKNWGQLKRGMSRTKRKPTRSGERFLDRPGASVS